jgi:hypothetical protein
LTVCLLEFIILLKQMEVELTKGMYDSDFYRTLMENHKEKIIFDIKKERYELKKRINHLEQSLEGMGISDFELTKSLEIKK